MKITESKLRKIIREELLREHGQFTNDEFFQPPDLEGVAEIVSQRHTRYPKLIRALGVEGVDDAGLFDAIINTLLRVGNSTPNKGMGMNGVADFLNANLTPYQVEEIKAGVRRLDDPRWDAARLADDRYYE